VVEAQSLVDGRLDLIEHIGLFHSTRNTLHEVLGVIELKPLSRVHSLIGSEALPVGHASPVGEEGLTLVELLSVLKLALLAALGLQVHPVLLLLIFEHPLSLPGLDLVDLLPPLLGEVGNDLRDDEEGSHCHEGHYEDGPRVLLSPSLRLPSQGLIVG